MDDQHMLAAETQSNLMRAWRRHRKAEPSVARPADLPVSLIGHLEAGTAAADQSRPRWIAACPRLPPRVRACVPAAASDPPCLPQLGLATPGSDVARGALDAFLAAQEPYPAVAIDRHWRVVSVNQAVASLVAGVEPMILRPRLNLLRLFLHPAGLSPRIVNLEQWRNHLTGRLQREIEQDQDPGLIDLLDEVRGYPRLPWRQAPVPGNETAVPLRIETIDGTLSFIATTTRFRVSADVRMSAISIEMFLPSDAATATFLRRARMLDHDRVGLTRS